jgi:amidohydrolase
MAALTGPADIRTPDSLIELRRALHADPELRFDLPRTAARVEKRLRAAGWQVQTGIATSGILATTASDVPGPHVMLRADMDAIAVTDSKDVLYASKNAGITHACGHDIHTSVMVGVAERLARSPLPAGRISIVFQPAEEMPYGEPSGAMTMLEEGLFEGDPPDVALAWHCWPDLPAGSIGVDDRISRGGKDAFHISMHGQPAHAATPSRGRDAILAISQTITALHQNFARSMDPSDLAILNVGTLQGGTTQSILAEAAEATGTFRSVDPVVRERLRAMVERTVAGAATMAGVDHELTWSEIVPPIVNDPRLAACAREVGRELLGDAYTYELSVPPMTADDFTFFAALAPSLYLKLGVCGGEACPPLHNGAFDVDERAIGVGVAVMHEIALRLLTRPLDSWAGD